MNGKLDEFRVWNIARTPAQIQADVDSTLTGNETNLVLYYKFDSASGTVATNSAILTGSAYNGTLVNVPAWVASLPAVVTTTNDSGPGSLRAFATGMPAGTTITFATNLLGQTIRLTNGEIFLQTDLTIDASALAGGLQINGNASSRIFEVAGGVSMTLKSLTLTNGYANQGGAIVNDDHGTLALINCALLNNIAYAPNYFGGGAICSSMNDGGSPHLALTNCILSGNSSLDNAGGAISINQGTLTMVQCTCSNNYSVGNSGGFAYGGAVNDDGASTMTFRQCLFVGNSSSAGGAISGNGPMILTDCSLSNNLATGGPGGALYQLGPLTMTNCTLTGNTASNGTGGAINFTDYSSILVDCTLSSNSATGSDSYPYSGGGAIFNQQANLTLIKCTLAGNSAANSIGGAIHNWGGALTLSQCTFADNSADVAPNNYGLYGGGAIYNNPEYGPLLITDSIIAGNTPDNIYGPFTGTNSLTSGDPMLAPLGNYGGPTQTMPPLPGSPAIDAGGPTTITTDQRGYPRVIGPAADIGAAEFFYTGNFVVTNSADSGRGSLRDLTGHLLDPNLNNSQTATVTFAPNLSGQTILLTNGAIDLNTPVTIDASALPGGMQINGNHTSRIFYVAQNISVALNSLILTNGYSPDGGAINIYFGSTLTLANCSLIGNTAPSGSGGGIYQLQATLILDQCTLSRNSALNGSGGAIFNVRASGAGSLDLNQCTLSGNSAPNGDGGAIYNGAGDFNGAPMSINQCTVTANSAGAGSGAIFIDDFSPSQTSVYNSIVTANTPSNIIGDYDGTPNLTSGNPMLAALGNYGGSTQTMPPLPGSPAIDAGDDSIANTLDTDQRGYPRLSGAHVDFGAVEGGYNTAGPGRLQSPTLPGNGTAIMTFTNQSGMIFTVLSSTNLGLPPANWSVLGTTIETPSGQYHFTDPQAAINAQTFYRVRSP